MKRVGISLIVLSVLPGLSLAQSGMLNVDAKSNIFGSGSLSNPVPAPGGGGGGVAAPFISLSAGSGRTATLLATGTWGWQGGPNNGPDGGNFSTTTNLSGVGGISGYVGPESGFLVGVFLDDNDPTSLAAPGNMVYGSLSDYALTSYSPGLQQVFFIGDGLTGNGSGSVQSFVVPDSATRLYLGVADGFGFIGAPGWYDDNIGSLDVNYDVVPEPATMAILAGVAGLIASRKRSK